MNREGDCEKGFSITDTQKHSVVLKQKQNKPKKKQVQIFHAKTVKHGASEKWKDKKEETELSQIKRAKKQIISDSWPV